MTKKILIGIVISCLVIIMGSYFLFNKDSNAEIKEVKYTYVNVTSGDIVIDLMADGQIEIPIREYSFKIEGEIESIDVELGQKVLNNDILATIDSEELENSLIEAKLNLENVIILKDKNIDAYNKNIVNYEYQVNIMKNNYELYKSTFDNMKLLIDVYSINDIENAERDYLNALNNYENYIYVNKPVSSKESDLISVEKAQITVADLENDLDNISINSISEGTVIEIKSSERESVSSSNVVLKVEEDGNVYIISKIQEIDILSIFKDQKAYIEIEAMLGKEFEAKVIEINRDPIIDGNGIVNYEVILELVDNNEEIMDGMTVTSTFVIVEKLNILKIPNKAVKIVNSKQVVNVVTGENSAKEVVIVTGLTDGKYVEVLSGLSVGDRLVYGE